MHRSSEFCGIVPTEFSVGYSHSWSHSFLEVWRHCLDIAILGTPLAN